jgi:hypothetical protein
VGSVDNGTYSQAMKQTAGMEAKGNLKMGHALEQMYRSPMVGSRPQGYHYFLGKKMMKREQWHVRKFRVGRPFSGIWRAHCTI